MNPMTVCYPNRACPARGQTGQGNTRIRSCKDQRCLCMECHKTFSVTKGTALYRLRTPAETVSLVVTLLAHGCPLQAIVRLATTVAEKHTFLEEARSLP